MNVAKRKPGKHPQQSAQTHIHTLTHRHTHTCQKPGRNDCAPPEYLEETILHLSASMKPALVDLDLKLMCCPEEKLYVGDQDARCQESGDKLCFIMTSHMPTHLDEP